MDLLDDIELRPELASVGLRWAAALIDYALWMIGVWFLIFVFGSATINEEGSTSYVLEGGMGLLAPILSWVIFLPLFEAINDGKTIGKAILKIRAVHKYGGRAGFGVLIARHLLDFVDYMPFFGIVGVLVAANNDQSQRVGDFVAGTIVIVD